MIVASSTNSSGLSAIDLQLTTIRRRFGLSPNVARIYVEHVFGDGQRADLAQLAALTADRIASSAEAR